MIRVKVLRDGELVCFRDFQSSRIARDYELRMAKLGLGTARDSLSEPTGRVSKPLESHRGNYHQVSSPNAS